MQVIGPACVFPGVHVAQLLRESFSCRGESDRAGSDGSWAHLLAVLTLRCAATPTGWKLDAAAPRPQQLTPQRKALTKGSGSPVKVVTSLDNGRKWRVDAGRTLELLR